MKPEMCICPRTLFCHESMHYSHWGIIVTRSVWLMGRGERETTISVKAMRFSTLRNHCPWCQGLPPSNISCENVHLLDLDNTARSLSFDEPRVVTYIHVHASEHGDELFNELVVTSADAPLYRHKSKRDQATRRSPR